MRNSQGQQELREALREGGFVPRSLRFEEGSVRVVLELTPGCVRRPRRSVEAAVPVGVPGVGVEGAAQRRHAVATWRGLLDDERLERGVGAEGAAGHGEPPEGPATIPPQPTNYQKLFTHPTERGATVRGEGAAAGRQPAGPGAGSVLPQPGGTLLRSGRTAGGRPGRGAAGEETSHPMEPVSGGVTREVSDDNLTGTVSPEVHP